MAEQGTEVRGVAQSPKTPLVAAFEHVVGKLATKGLTAALYEETLTSFLFGGIASSFPLMAEKYGHPDGPRACSWKQFSKGSASKAGTEAASGADLALVLWHSADLVRVAVFQAKKAEFRASEDRDEIDINQVPDNPGERRTQFAMLVATGVQFADYMFEKKYALTTDLVIELENLWPEPRSALSSNDNLPWHVAAINWIHYLAYKDGGPRCLAINDVELKAIEWEFRRSKGRNGVKLSKSIGLLDLLNAGVRGGEGWLTLNAEQLKKLLPSLIHIAPTLVVDESGGGVDLKLEGVHTIEEVFDVKGSDPESVAQLNAFLEKSQKGILERSPANDDGGSPPQPGRVAPKV